MNPQSTEFHNHIHRLITLFYSAYKMVGKFKLMLHVSEAGVDEAGNRVVTMFLLPLDVTAHQSMTSLSGNFLVLQVLDSLVPEPVMSSDYEIRVMRAPVIPIGHVEISVVNITVHNAHLTRALYNAYSNSQSALPLGGLG
ncbi:MAG: hypothetical protein AB7P76_06075 [Candidatus Melainabacteria bacterium]